MAAAKPKAKPDSKAKAKDNKDKRTPQDYGYVKGFLDDHPQIARLVKKAVKEGWTKDRLQGSVKETRWWRNTEESQRRADLLESESPAEYQGRIADITTKLATQAQAMGISYTPAQLSKYAAMAFRNGYTPEEITQWLGSHGGLDVEDAKGAAAVTADGLREMAQGYGLKMTNATIARAVRSGLQSGDPSGFLAGYQDTLREQAKTAFPSVADQLDRGLTVRDIMSNNLQMAGQELGIDPDSLDISDPKWTRMLTGGEGGGPMDQMTWQRTYRNDTQYGWNKTPAAKEQAGQLASQLAQLMGVSGFGG